MHLRTMAVLLAAFGIHSVCAQQTNEEKAAKLTEFIEETLDMLETVPGVAISMVQGDELLYARGFGHADLQGPLPMTPETSFYIASCTKSFTGLLAVLMDEAGILPLDMTLADALPDVPFDPSIEADKIRMQDLLNHTAGLDHPSIAYRLAYTGDHDHKTLMELLPFLEADVDRRGVYGYTNLGYNIYTIILEEKTGKPWQDWLEEKIFDPMGMHRTTAYISQADKEGWPMALPYAGFDEVEQVYLQKKDNTMQSAGGLITTASDAARWMRMQLQEGRIDGVQVFSKETILKTRELSVAGDEDRGAFDMQRYGLGLSMGQFDGRTVMWHSGGFPGYLSTISFMPQQQLGVTVFVNDAVAGNQLMHLLMDYAYDAWLQPEGWEERYRKDRKALISRTNALKQKVLSGRAKRAKRKWELSREFEAYTGTFQNELFGQVNIELKGPRQLQVSIGNLHCIATPFTQPETIRVELIPGRGEVISFEQEGEEITAIRASGFVFKKVDSGL